MCASAYSNFLFISTQIIPQKRLQKNAVDNFLGLLYNIDISNQKQNYFPAISWIFFP